MKQFKGKIVLVTGGTGSIGSEIVRQLLAEGAAQVRILSRDEHKQHELKQELKSDCVRYLLGDVRDRDRLDLAFREVDVCFHAAALKHVPFCEYNPFEAVKTNIIGTQNVIDMAIKHNLERVISISTDKAVSPSSVLGASKLMAERLITAASLIKGKTRTRFSSVRFGNVMGSRGSVIHVWRRQIDEGGPITVTDKRAVRYFMEIPDAVQLIFSACKLMKGGEIFVLKMAERSILEFAQEVIATYANGKKIKIDFVGLRPGEKLREGLLTPAEASHSLETKDLLVILPEDSQYYTVENFSYTGARKLSSMQYVSG